MYCIETFIRARCLIFSFKSINHFIKHFQFVDNMKINAKNDFKFFVAVHITRKKTPVNVKYSLMIENTSSNSALKLLSK